MNDSQTSVTKKKLYEFTIMSQNKKLLALGSKLFELVLVSCVGWSQNMLRQLDMTPYDHYRPQAGTDHDGSQIIWY